MVVEIPGIKFLSCYIFDKNQFVFHLISQQHIKKNCLILNSRALDYVLHKCLNVLCKLITMTILRNKKITWSTSRVILCPRIAIRIIDWTHFSWLWKCEMVEVVPFFCGKGWLLKWLLVIFDLKAKYFCHYNPFQLTKLRKKNCSSVDLSYRRLFYESESL